MPTCTGLTPPTTSPCAALRRPDHGPGPGIKYDLGRWSFLLKTQLETGNQDRGADGMQSSVRVWYAF